MRTIFIQIIKIYKLLLSPFLGRRCRFQPSCSDYAIQAIDRHGALRGGRLMVWRLLRCHPWSAGFDDPVPPLQKDNNKNANSKNANSKNV